VGKPNQGGFEMSSAYPDAYQPLFYPNKKAQNLSGAYILGFYYVV
jgi:hypothetical protein